MSGHLNFVPLYHSPTVTIRDVECRPHGPERGGEEVSTDHTIVFPRSGVFVKHVDGEEVVVDVNHVVFFKRLQPYRVSHPVSGGDDCTVYQFAPDVLTDAFAAYDPAVRDRPERLLGCTHVPSPTNSVLLHQRLRRASGGTKIDPIRVEEWAMDLLADVVGCAYEVRNSALRDVRRETLRVHRERADAAKTVLSHRMRERLSLADLAGSVHTSAFHLARLFRREAGIPIHQYLNRLRLRASLERLAEGEADLTGLALDLGFSSHGHFTDAFRREFGITPSGFRRLLSRTRLREMSKKLEV